MAEEKYGFLTPTQREYLRGEKDMSEYSNPSVFRKRIRQRIRRAQKDWQLLAESDVMTDEELQRALRDLDNSGVWDRSELPDQMIGATKNAGKAQAHAVVGGELDPLIDTMEYIASEKAIRERESKELIIDAVMGLLSEFAGYNEEQMSDWIRRHWPSKTFAINYIKRKRED